MSLDSKSLILSPLRSWAGSLPQHSPYCLCSRRCTPASAQAGQPTGSTSNWKLHHERQRSRRKSVTTEVLFMVRSSYLVVFAAVTCLELSCDPVTAAETPVQSK